MCSSIFQHAPSSQTPPISHPTWRPEQKKPVGLNLQRTCRIKDLISKFSSEDSGYLSNSFTRGGQAQRPTFKEFDIPELIEVEIPAPSATETGAREPDSSEATAAVPQLKKPNAEQTKTADSGSDSVADSGTGSVSIASRVAAVHEESSPWRHCSSVRTMHDSRARVPQSPTIQPWEPPLPPPHPHPRLQILPILSTSDCRQ